MVRILCYHCRECSSETWSGNKDFACCTLWPKNQKWTNKKKKTLDTRWTIGVHVGYLWISQVVLVVKNCLPVQEMSETRV